MSRLTGGSQVAPTNTSSAAHIAGFASPFSTDNRITRNLGGGDTPSLPEMVPEDRPVPAHRPDPDRLFPPCRLCRLFEPEQPATASASIRLIAVAADLFI